MLRRGMALALILALSLALTACGGSSEEAASDAPSSGQAASVAPQVEATPADVSDEPRVEATPSDASGAPQVEPTATVATPAEAPSATEDIVEHLRHKTMQLWEVYNGYDGKGLEVFYEASYWEEKKDTVFSDLANFETAGLVIVPEETSPPTEIAPGKWEMRQVGNFGIGTVRLIFVYEEFDGEWLLTVLEPY